MLRFAQHDFPFGCGRWAALGHLSFVVRCWEPGEGLRRSIKDSSGVALALYQGFSFVVSSWFVVLGS